MVFRRSSKKNASAKQPDDVRLLKRSLISISIALAMGSNVALADPPRGAFPRACTAVSCTSPNGPIVGWKTYGETGYDSPQINGSTMTIDQLSDKVILNWENFDIGADNTVVFQQPDGSSVALNRVWDTRQ